MHNELISAFNYSLQNRTDCIVEVDIEKLDQKPFLDEHVSKNALRIFSPDELHNRELNLNFMNTKASFLIKLKNGSYSFHNRDEIEEVIIKKVDEYHIYQLHYLKFFRALAECNHFGSVEESPLKDVFGIGSIAVAGKKIGWFFVLDISKEEILILKSMGFDYLIISSTNSHLFNKELANVYYHPINFDFNTWKFDLSKIVNPENGFEVQDYVEISSELLVLDTVNEAIYIKKTKLSRNSSRDFKYVQALTIAGDQGLSKERFAKLLLISSKQVVKTAVNLDKQRLKRSIQDTFENQLEIEEVFQLLNLGNAKNGSRVRINLRPDQIKIF